MDKIAITKKVVSFVVGTSTGHCIAAIVAHSLDPKSTREKAEVIIGSYVVGAMVGDAAKAWSDKQIDSLVSSWNELRSKKA